MAFLLFQLPSSQMQLPFPLAAAGVEILVMFSALSCSTPILAKFYFLLSMHISGAISVACKELPSCRSTQPNEHTQLVCVNELAAAGLFLVALKRGLT